MPKKSKLRRAILRDRRRYRRELNRATRAHIVAAIAFTEDVRPETLREIQIMDIAQLRARRWWPEHIQEIIDECIATQAAARPVPQRIRG